MPTKKIADHPREPDCKKPGHNPNMLTLMKPGTYEHECPHCGHKQTFTIMPPGTF